MSLLLWFAIGALVGTSSCDTECFKSVFSECKLNAVDNCARLSAAYECGAQKAADCSMGFAGQARDVSGAIGEVCAGTLRSKFLAQKECYVDALDFEGCFYLVYNMTSYIEGPEDFVKMNKEGCRNLDVYSQCVSKNVQQRCADASPFHRLFDPMMRLSQGLCREVILPAEEKVIAPDDPGLLSVFSLVVLSFYYV